MIKLKHYGERSFSYAAPVEWNKLDVEIRSLANLKSFKKKFKTILNTHQLGPRYEGQLMSDGGA